MEDNFICDNEIYDKSVCYYTGDIYANDYSIEKDPFDNIFIL